MKMERKHIILFSIVFLLFIVGIFIGISNFNKDIPNNEPTKETNEEKNNTEENLSKEEQEEFDNIMDSVDGEHHEYDEGLINEEEDSIIIEDIVFDQPVLIEDAIVKNSGASLIGATEELLLFKTIDNILYTYDLKTKRVSTINEDVKEAMITTGNEYIFYVKDMRGSDVIHEYDIALRYDKGPMFAVFDGWSISNLTYSNGALYYTYPLADISLTNKGKGYSLSKLYIMPKHRKTLGTIQDEDLEIKHTTKAFTKANNVFYYYSDKDKSVHKIDLKGQNKKLDTLKENIKHPELLAVNHKEKWILLDRERLAFDSTLHSSDGIIKDFERTYAAEWFYNDYLLIADNEKLYFYNPETKEKHLLKPDVFTFVTTKNTIYYQDMTTEDNEIYMIKTKRQD